MIIYYFQKSYRSELILIILEIILMPTAIFALFDQNLNIPRIIVYLGCYYGCLVLVYYITHHQSKNISKLSFFINISLNYVLLGIFYSFRFGNIQSLLFSILWFFLVTIGKCIIGYQSQTYRTLSYIEIFVLGILIGIDAKLIEFCIIIPISVLVVLLAKIFSPYYDIN
jgi:hypothetical protein